MTIRRDMRKQPASQSASQQKNQLKNLEYEKERVSGTRASHYIARAQRAYVSKSN